MKEKEVQSGHKTGVDFTKHYDEVIGLLKELVVEKINNLTSIIERDRITNEQARSLFKETNDAHLMLLNGETERTKARELEFKEKESHFASRDLVEIQIQGLREKLQTVKTDISVMESMASMKDLEKIGKRSDLGMILSVVSILVMLLSLYLTYGK